MLSTWAVAKLNLHLSIGNRRADGYHQLLSLVQMVALADRINLSILPAKNVVVKLNLEGTLDCPAAENLAVRAVELFLMKGGYQAEVVLYLRKEIPAGAGLGGGSSDAAAALRLLNQHYYWPFSQQQLLLMASELGSDVPMFLYSGAMLVTGRGELIYPLPSRPELSYLIIVPQGWFCATGELYRLLDTERVQERSTGTVIIDKERLTSSWLGNPATWPFANDFEMLLVRRYPDLPLYLQCLRDGGALAVGVSGSGAALWAVYNSALTCQRGQARLRANCDCWITATEAVIEPSLIEI